ncbi:MAG: 2OG-Fe(II) oxygenase superfamily, partial [Actinomycetia bacterium]|nr:2OG-Fe(II) oxygenase superfamily [Actinomycetes bacterium]
LQDVWGTPYLELPDESRPEGHPRRTSVHSRTWILAYDLVSSTSPARVLYEWDGLKDFLAEVLDRDPLYRMADPLGALNLTAMDDGHIQGWHYDSTDFVVSLAVQASDAGGEFECARMIRDTDDEHYDDVAQVLAGNGEGRVEVYPMTPGTLMVFMGRHSLHRVAPVRGERPRVVALFAYDTTPDASSSDLLKLVRYGRTEPRDAA